MKNSAQILLVTTTVLITGCTTLGLNHIQDHYREASEQFDRVDKHSSFPAIRRDYFENVNLVELVNPEYPSNENINCEFNQNSKSQQCKFKYDLAFAKFREKVQNTSE